MNRVSRRRVLGALAVGAAAAPVMAACGETQVVEVVKEVPVVEERVVTQIVEKVVTAPAMDPGSLTIYSGRSESLVDPIIRQFADATGIDVGVKYAKTGELAATLLEEGDASPADIFFAQDPGGLGSVESLLSPLPGEVFGRVPEWARSGDGLWVGISGRARV
ncbi:MAG: iron ABC transporter substrate-binding protein, partial [Chloroflexi bacterium]|nr:iron ABC transporter substrate-binding protein [Chloroflexota bacterium]